MKLQIKHTTIERIGVHSESTFTIKTNALSFSILSSGLYTDPEMAIIRELSCNAYDAHLAANNEKTPFEIHLPNELEPFLSIKDYGTGLSDEDIQGKMVQTLDENNTINRVGGLYTTYFDSTKTDSNDFIGALGLGSKSPFSYTSAFEVISRHQGKKRTYAIFLNEEGIPSVALMAEINTDEHSGLEVKIAIKKDDFYKFKTKTATALKYFPIKPKVIGALQFEFDPIPTYNIKTKDWMISSSNYYNSSIIAVQGNVAYRVDADQIREKLNEKLNEFIRYSNIVVFFNIGELEVSANREEIRYDKRSVDAIVKRIEKINIEFTQEVEKKIGKVNKKYWYACIELNELSRNLFNKSDIIRSFVNPKKVKNKNLKRYIENNGNINYSRLLGYELLRYTINGYRVKSTKLKRSVISALFEPSGDTLVVINDLKKGAIKRLGEYLIDNSYNEAIVIRQRTDPIPKFNDNKKPIKYEGFKKEFNRLKKELGNPDIYKLSEITTEPEKSSASRELTFYEYDGMISNRTSYINGNDKISWKKTIHKLEDGGLYIPIKYASTPSLIDSQEKLIPLKLNVVTDTIDSIWFLIDSYNDINDTNYTIDDLYGFPGSVCKKTKKLNNWVNLFDFGKDILPKYMNEIIFHKSKQLTSPILGAKEAIKYKDFVNNVKELDNGSAFKQAIMPLIESQEKYSKKILDKIDTITILYQNLYKDQTINSTTFYDDSAFDKYPMLTLVDSLCYGTTWSTLFDYIKLIDKE